ncbi:MAG: DNA replication/repair protein RecF [Armatimonadota bacterium]
MRVNQLILHNFRNYSDLSIQPDPKTNVLIGKNAQGKTSILEAIYLLATARSWKTGRDSEMVSWGEEAARVWAEVERDEQNDIEIEIQLYRTGKKQVSVNTIRQTRLGDLLGQVNAVLIEPHDVDIVRGEPGQRRRFMNLEISQIQPQYCNLIADYKRVLEQRNRLLRESEYGGELLDVLSEQLVTYGVRILERRLSFVEKLAGIARVIHSQITDGEEELAIEYACSFPLGGEIEEQFRAALAEKRREELRRGITLVGPQRDDLIFAVNGVDARIYGSQGQQRSISLSLRLAELEIMEEGAGEPPVVLLDDVMTDLDEERRAHVFQMTRGRCQTFVTAASGRVFEPEFLAGSAVFKVSKGEVTAE